MSECDGAKIELLSKYGFKKYVTGIIRYNYCLNYDFDGVIIMIGYFYSCKYWYLPCSKSQCELIMNKIVGDLRNLPGFPWSFFGFTGKPIFFIIG